MNHSQLVSALIKPAKQIMEEMTDVKTNILHMVVGISGETGELLDAIKKVVYYNKPIDRENVVEELGDIEFYLEGLRQQLSITRDECITNNITKLSKRYHSLTFSNDNAVERADKK